MEIAVLKAIAAELAAVLPGMRLIELAEGDAGEVFLVFKGEGGKKALLIGPRPGLPRLYLISGKPPRSKELTPFASSLNNSIVGSNVVTVSQPGLERTVIIEFSGRKGKTSLVVEMAGKKPNIIVLDEAGRITLAQSYVSISEEAQRPLLPGLNYEPPPLPDRADPYTLTADTIMEILSENPGLATDKAIFKKVGGISPVLAAEAVARAGGPNPDKILKEINGLLTILEKGEFSPTIYETPKGPALAAFKLVQYAGLGSSAYASMNEAAEAYYDRLVEEREFAAKKTSVVRELRARLAAVERKLSAIGAEATGAGMADTYQLYGQVLMASPGQVPGSVDKVVLPNLFSEGEPLEIPLDPMLDQVKNAEAWFKKARKAKSAAAIIRERLAATVLESERLKGQLKTAEQATSLEELSGGKPSSAKEARVGKGAERRGIPEFPSFKSSDGYEVVFARNAKMNDVLTFKLAQPMDLWLHVQGYHGGHVIVRNPERRPDIPLQTILEAAEVAAFNSGAKKDSSVAVDYTFKKYVRKPKDPAPGQAIFTNNKTVFVEPKKR